MKLTVYRQSEKTRPDGTIVYKGEDGRPYVDGQLLFVADGLGGAAAIRHLKFNQDLFNSEKLLDTLFEGIYEDYSNEIFSKYVVDSFYELFAVKDCYTDNVNNIKKSGFFASRIVTAIILHEMLYNGEYCAEKLFDGLACCEGDEAKLEYINGIGQHFKDLIQTKLKQISQKVNLIYESSYTNLALLGSTLCATIYLEREDKVEALYLTAGDSRPYVWSESNGLCQVLPDQEGADGGMTNYIKANDGADFHIRCNYFSFAKPCILFNASDGCFDSGKFTISQLGFEKLILESGVEADDMEKLGEALYSFFVVNGRHDDSSTIAMKAFGYESYDALKQSFRARLDILNSEYFEKMPDILDVDYGEICEDYERKLPIQLAAIKEKFSETQVAVDYCSEYIKSGQFAPYTDRIKEIDEKIASKRCRIDQAMSEIYDVVSKNYIKFKTSIECEDTRKEQRILDEIEKLESNHLKMSEEYITRIQRYKEELGETVTAVETLLENIYHIGIPMSYDDYDETSLKLVKNCEDRMDELFDFFNGLRKHREKTVSKLIEQRKDYEDKNLDLAKKNPQDIEQICKLLVSGEIDVSQMNILEEESLRISEELEAISEAKAAISKLENEDKETVYSESYDLFWDSKYVDVILAVIADPKYAIDEALAEEARSIINDFGEKTKSVRESHELQKALVEKYDATYYMYMEAK